ncbi:toll/interleukin-1 receptor domain-containing protein [Coprobacillaceae bacterium CR2/5/TPMF4]|nr:toll/interleukin-1 receptor domain-containing protein [Coprobacillaceae bacterium CR2/5/TPMF4]
MKNIYILIKNKKKDSHKVYNKIFLSHSSNDKKYGDALEKFIISLGIKNDQLIYTSHPLHKIPTNENIYSYLKSNIGKNIYVIFLFSDNYLNSVACLNEMGAAWITETDYVNIYVPNFNFDNPKYRQCMVDTAKMGIILKMMRHAKWDLLI